MNRTLLLSTDAIYDSHEVVVEVGYSSVGRLALELTLLICGLAQRLSLIPAAGPRVVLVVRQGVKEARASVTLASKEVVLTMPENLAEYVQSVLLRAYRDGVAEVNHIHVEGVMDGDVFDLTLLFTHARQPLSPEEAEKRMKD